MSTKKITIDQFLYKVLSDSRNKEFTVVQIRDEYLKVLPSPITPIEARKSVYRQLLRLVKISILTKNRNSNPQQTKYRVSQYFSRLNFKLTTPYHQRNCPSQMPNKEIQDHQSVRFEEQLKQYQVDLMSSIGESEEYKRLYTVNPGLKALLEAQYHQARDKSSKLLGQIKAINTVISHLAKQEQDI